MLAAVSASGSQQLPVAAADVLEEPHQPFAFFGTRKGAGDVVLEFRARPAGKIDQAERLEGLLFDPSRFGQHGVRKRCIPWGGERFASCLSGLERERTLGGVDELLIGNDL